MPGFPWRQTCGVGFGVGLSPLTAPQAPGTAHGICHAVLSVSLEEDWWHQGRAAQERQLGPALTMCAPTVGAPASRSTCPSGPQGPGCMSDDRAAPP